MPCPTRPTPFRDWAAGCSDAPRDVCELALALVNSDRVEAAYRRTNLFEKRRDLMEDWSKYVAVRPTAIDCNRAAMLPSID